MSELVAVLGMPQGKVSRHLAVLKHAGLVADRREGTWVHYSLCGPDSLLRRLLHTYLQAEDGRPDCAAEDRQRLEELACDGQVLVRRTSPEGAVQAGTA